MDVKQKRKAILDRLDAGKFEEGKKVVVWAQCEHTTLSAFAKGLCRECYYRQWQKNRSDKDRLRQRIKVRSDQMGVDLTPELLDEMYKTQNGKCGACEEGLPDWKEDRRKKDSRLVFDEDLERLVGILCKKCGKALRAVERSRGRLELLIKYLDTHVRTSDEVVVKPT